MSYTPPPLKASELELTVYSTPLLDEVDFGLGVHTVPALFASEFALGIYVLPALDDVDFDLGSIYFGILKRWNGAIFIKEPLKVYTGAVWLSKPLKRWSGTDWVLIDTSGA